MALLVLFRLTTGDNWNGIMKDGLRTPPESMYLNITQTNVTCSFKLDCDANCCKGCDDSMQCKENCCVSLWVSPVYFCSFVLLAQFVMLNLVVAVLMQELEEADDYSEGEGAETGAAGEAASSTVAPASPGTEHVEDKVEEQSGALQTGQMRAGETPPGTPPANSNTAHRKQRFAVPPDAPPI